MNNKNLLRAYNLLGYNPLNYDMYDEFAQIKDEQQLEQWIYSRFEALGFSGVALAVVPYGAGTYSKCFTNFKDNWFEHYNQNQFFDHDPVANHLIHHSTPVFWQQSFDKNRFSKTTHRLFSESEDFGLVQGVAIPLNLKQGKGTVSLHFEGSEKAFLAEYQHKCFELLGLSQAIHSKLALDFPAKLYEGPALTKRQLECLKYMANGFSNVEIAEFMTLSHYTVRDLVSQIIKRLNASNRTEATMLAIKSGLI